MPTRISCANANPIEGVPPKYKAGRTTTECTRARQVVDCDSSKEKCKLGISFYNIHVGAFVCFL